MAELFTHILQYFSIALIFMLMISSWHLLTKNEEDTVFGYRVNIMLTLLLNVSLAGAVIINNLSWYNLAFFGAVFLYLFFFPLIFRAVYKKANRLMINLIMIMCAVGLPVIARLDSQKAVKQFVFLLAGSFIALFVPALLKRFEATKKMAGFAGIAGLCALALVLVLSKTTYGANLSISLGPVSLQPSEFVKITYILLLAKMFRQRQDMSRILAVAGVAAIHTGILVLSKDLGGAAIYFGIFIVVLFVATGKKRFVLFSGALLAGGGVLAYLLFSHVRVRVTAWSDPWSVIDNQGYQIAQSLFSIADGGVLGTGLCLGSPRSIPVVEKDFIFSAICEELGLIFGLCLIMLCLFLFICMLKVAMKNSVIFYKLCGAGLAASYGLQSFLTIGGSIKLIPSTGVTLPFVSYGGSSLTASLLMFGILQGLFIKGNAVEDAKKLEKELAEGTTEEVTVDEDGRKVIRRRVKVPNRKQQRVLEGDDTRSAAVISNNKASRLTGYGFITIFMICAVYLTLFVMIGSNEPQIQNNSYHLARGGSESPKVIRGSILGSDGVVLAYTEVENGEEKRVYPFDNLFAHPVGYADSGTTGIENLANQYLLNATRTISESLRDDLKGGKKQGDSVVTTIDPSLQFTAYQAMGEHTGAVVVMEADTGKVLAMCSKPDFDPNRMAQIWEDISETGNTESFLVNRATMGLYPPGSTFKLLTMLAYLRENDYDISKYSYTCTGSFTYGDTVIGCSEGHEHGALDLMGGLSESCNGVFADIGTRLKNDTLSDIASEFLFGTDLETGMPVKKSSLPVTPDTTAEERTQICIGQGAVVETPLHNAMITAAIANGGYLVKPYLIDRVVSSTGNTVRTFDSKVYGRVMTAQETEILEQAMLGVVENGTGFNAKTDAYHSAGKTGSAQFSGSTEDLHAWYTGYAWKDGGKRIVVSVILEGGGSGGWNAAPVAKTILDKYFGVS